MRAIRLLLAVPLALLFGLVPRSVADDAVLFADDFQNELSGKWHVVGLTRTDYRIRNGGLEIRVQPGEMGPSTPRVQVVLPFTADDTVVASVRVTVLTDFTRNGEFAGVYLIDESGPEFGAKKERVDGALVFAPGAHEFTGLPGEEGDPAKYAVRYTRAAGESGPLRVVVDRRNAHFQVGPSPQGKYLNFFHSAIRGKTEKRGFCLVAAGAPAGAAHWVRFEDFRVFRR